MSFLANFILDDSKKISERIDFSEVKNKSILITGAFGLLGHYLVASLSQASRSGGPDPKILTPILYNLSI
jgi:hypothetical protein